MTLTALYTRRLEPTVTVTPKKILAECLDWAVAQQFGGDSNSLLKIHPDDRVLVLL